MTVLKLLSLHEKTVQNERKTLVFLQYLRYTYKKGILQNFLLFIRRTKKLQEFIAASKI